MFTRVDSYEIELSSDCNAACPLCTRTDLGMPLRGNNNITLDDIRRVFNNKETYEDVEFLLSGVLGDPILNPQCYDICKYLSERGGITIVNTNGGYGTVKFWSKMAELERLHVNFAVDGGPETNHLYRKNVKWETLLRNMTAYSKADGSASCVFIEFDHNFQDLETVETLAKSLNFKLKTRVNRDKGWRPDLPASKNKNPEDHMVTAYDVKRLFGKHQEYADVINEVGKSIKCRYLQDPSLYIAADMTLWPCCHLYSYVKNSQENKKKFDGMYPDGYNDLRTRTVFEILQDPAFTEIEQRWNAYNQNFLGKCITTCAKGGFRSRTNPALYEKLKNN
jgi:MoaA/NifB/PqqE/SkfB family radical SAM enzyme